MALPWVSACFVKSMLGTQLTGSKSTKPVYHHSLGHLLIPKPTEGLCAARGSGQWFRKKSLRARRATRRCCSHLNQPEVGEMWDLCEVGWFNVGLGVDLVRFVG